MREQIWFNLKDDNNLIVKLKSFCAGSYRVSLEINLLRKSNRDKFFRLQAKLRKEYPEIFPIGLELNERLNKTAIFHIG